MALSYLTNVQFGTFPFIRLTEPPPAPRYHGIVEARPGVDGYGVWREARRGVPWKSESFIDTLDRATGLAICRQYELVPFSGVWTILWEQVALPLNVVILEVGEFHVQDIVMGVGGINPLSRATIRASWTFLS